MTGVPAENEYTGTGKPDVAVDFLKLMQPEGPWALTCIAADHRGIDTRTFKPEDEDKCLAWIVRWNGKRNLYWHVNPVRRLITSKAEKADIARMMYLHVDIDPRSNAPLAHEHARILTLLRNLPDGIPRPSMTVFSGGGYQAYWRLTTPIELDGSIEAAEEVELYNKWLEEKLGGDHCHNVDRIMRLPGTINLPDKRKAAKGRVAALAYVVEGD